MLLSHFPEMKGDVAMSPHEKEEKHEHATPRQEVIDNPIPTSLILSDMHSSVLCRYF